jgi:hypothetical protein
MFWRSVWHPATEPASAAPNAIRTHVDRFNGPSCALRPSRLSFILSQRFGYVGIESQDAQIETHIYFGYDGCASGIALRPVGTAVISSNAGFLVGREQTEFACLVRRFLAPVSLRT